MELRIPFHNQRKLPCASPSLPFYDFNSFAWFVQKSLLARRNYHKPQRLIKLVVEILPCGFESVVTIKHFFRALNKKRGSNCNLKNDKQEPVITWSSRWGKPLNMMCRFQDFLSGAANGRSKNRETRPALRPL